MQANGNCKQGERREESKDFFFLPPPFHFFFIMALASYSPLIDLTPPTPSILPLHPLHTSTQKAPFLPLPLPVLAPYLPRDS